jgi:hypothetical protein
LSGIPPRVVLAEALARLAYLGRLRGCALELTRAGEPRDRLHASKLAARVALQLDLQDSPWFRKDLSAALHVVGWRSVNVTGVRMWKGRLMR